MYVRPNYKTKSSTMASDYAWIIDRDHLYEGSEAEGTLRDDDVSEKGTAGPRDASPENLARLDAGEGDTFRMYDDDGFLYYTGRLVTSDGLDPYDAAGCPLDDFGTPNAGAVTIEWEGYPERAIG